MGLLSYFVLQQYVSQQTHYQQAQLREQMRYVLVAATPLEKGEIVQPEQLQQRLYPPEYIADDWLTPTDAAAIIGLKTTHFIERGQPLQLAMLAGHWVERFSHHLAPEQYAITTAINIEQIHHGMLSVGDIVLIVSLNEHNAITAIEDVEVIALDQQQQHISDGLPTTVTFAMNGVQAQQFEQLRRLGFQLWLQNPREQYSQLKPVSTPKIHIIAQGGWPQ